MKKLLFLFGVFLITTINTSVSAEEEEYSCPTSQVVLPKNRTFIYAPPCPSDPSLPCFSSCSEAMATFDLSKQCSSVYYKTHLCQAIPLTSCASFNAPFYNPDLKFGVWTAGCIWAVRPLGQCEEAVQESGYTEITYTTMDFSAAPNPEFIKGCLSKARYDAKNSNMVKNHCKSKTIPDIDGEGINCEAYHSIYVFEPPEITSIPVVAGYEDNAQTLQWLCRAKWTVSCGWSQR